MPGERTLHDLLAHLLGWDEWAVGVFEISALRALPPVLIEALRDVDDYNARDHDALSPRSPATICCRRCKPRRQRVVASAMADAAKMAGRRGASRELALRGRRR